MKWSRQNCPKRRRSSSEQPWGGSCGSPARVQRQHHVAEQVPAGRVPLAAEAAVHHVFLSPLFQRQVTSQLRVVRKRYRHADMRIVVTVAVEHEPNARYCRPASDSGSLSK